MEKQILMLLIQILVFQMINEQVRQILIVHLQMELKILILVLLIQILAFQINKEQVHQILVIHLGIETQELVMVQLQMFQKMKD